LSRKLYFSEVGKWGIILFEKFGLQEVREFF